MNTLLAGSDCCTAVRDWWHCFSPGWECFSPWRECFSPGWDCCSPGWECFSNVDLIQCQHGQHVWPCVIRRRLRRLAESWVVVVHQSLPELVLGKQHLLVVQVDWHVVASQTSHGETQPLAPQPPPRNTDNNIWLKQLRYCRESAVHPGHSLDLDPRLRQSPCLDLTRTWILRWTQTRTLIDWLSRGFMSHSTQNRSFRRRFPKPICWLGMEKTKPNQKKCTRTQNKHKKLKTGLVVSNNTLDVAHVWPSG